jgi:hypothetical protein
VIGLDDIDKLTGGRLGTHDVACPECGPLRRSVRGQRKPVLRVYRIEPTFAGYFCARCGAKGAAAERNGRPPDPEKLAAARAQAAERDHELRLERLGKARWLWSHRIPIAGSIAERYLREARGYSGPLPATLAFLPARGDYHPALISAFGLAHEVEPGIIAIRDQDVRGVHLTRLRADGLGKATFEDADEPAKIMIGHSTGSPIVLAPPNDLLGLVLAEGIEKALSVYEATGCGTWVAGSASRMPALADIIPDYIETARPSSSMTILMGAATPPNSAAASRPAASNPD